MEDRRTWLYLAFGSTALLLSAYAVWHLTKNEDCPFRLKDKTIKLHKTAFHGIVPWECSQDEKVKTARTWMEKYVKSAIMKSKKNVTKDFLEKNLTGRKRLMSAPESEAGK